MSKDENRIGNIESFYYWICDFDVFKGLTMLLAVILTVVCTCIESSSISELYKYPAEEYKYLTEEIQKVVVGNNVDMNRISTYKFEISETYIRKAGETDWSICKIDLTRDATVHATITKTDDGTLSMDISHVDKEEHIFTAISITVIATVVIFVVAFLFSAVFVGILFFIIWILKSIEKEVLKRRNRKC